MFQNYVRTLKNFFAANSNTVHTAVLGRQYARLRIFYHNTVSRIRTKLCSRR